LSGGLIMLGYAAFSWRRATRKRERPKSVSDAPPSQGAGGPRLAQLEHRPVKAASPAATTSPPANSNAASRGAELGALFLGRASAALSPFHLGPDWPEGGRWRRAHPDKGIRATPAMGANFYAAAQL